MTSTLNPTRSSSAAKKPAHGNRAVPPRKSAITPRKSGLLTALMVCVAAYFLLPLVWLAFAATKSDTGLFTSFGFAFASDGFKLFDNIASVFAYQDGVFLKWLGNTALYAGVGAIGATLLATAAGYAFAKYEFPGRKALFSVLLGSIMVPLTALAVPTYLLFSGMQLTNTMWAVILPSIISPFGAYLMRVYAADAVDTSLMESARIDGAGELRIFWQIGLRLLAPGIVTVFLFAVVATWNNYFLPLIMLNNGDLFPLTVGLAQWQATSTSGGGGGGGAMFSMVITGSFVSIIPLIFLFLYLQRYWQSGLAAGSVKG